MPNTRKTLQFDPLEPPRILVDIQVTRVERYPREKSARIWGYVGDYEVAVTLPSSDERVRSLARLHKMGQQLQGSDAGT